VRRALASVVLLAGCGDGTDETAPAANAPPTVSVPEASAAGEGQTTVWSAVATDPDGDLVTLTAAATNADVAVSVQGTEIELHPGYASAGTSSIELDAVDARGAAAELSVPLEVSAIGWQPTTTWNEPAGPEAREHPAVVVDGDRAVFIGGSGYDPYGEPLGDVWSFDLAAGTWSAVTAAGDVPSPGGSRRTARHGDGSTYLFGGYGDNFALNAELYRFDPETDVFTQVAQTGPPSPRALHAFVHDPETDRFWAFGGLAAFPLDDLWSMQIVDGAAVWEQHDVQPRPSPRYGFFYGFDAVAGRLVVFSGAQGTAQIDPARDTWVLDVRATPPVWQLVLEGEAVPPGRRNGCMVFDPSGPRFFVFGGTPDAMTTEPGLWAFDARAGHERWDQVVRPGEPPLRSSGAALYDAGRDRTWFGFGNSSSGVYRDLTALGY
jgi:hypothetical protein